MKQYVYRPSDLGLSAWPQGELRLEGIEKTDDPSEADLLVLPAALSNFGNDSAALERIPFLSGRPDRLVCFDVSDFDTVFTVRDPILIRCNVKPFMRAGHPNTIAWPWPVDDFASCVPLPAGGFEFDVSFQGWMSTAVRRESSHSCRVDPRLHADVAQYNDFAGYLYDKVTGLPTAEWLRRHAEFRRSMQASRIALCPESIAGVLPYRFFEALSAGRVPMLVGSGYELPFADRIPYQDFIIECPADRAERACDYVWSFVDSLRDDQIVEMGLIARHYWTRYLNRDDWPRRMAEEVIRSLEARQQAAR